MEDLRYHHRPGEAPLGLSDKKDSWGTGASYDRAHQKNYHMSTAPTLLPADAAADRQRGVISGSITVGSAVAARWQQQLAGSAAVAAAALQRRQRHGNSGGSAAAAGSVAVGQWQRAARQQQRQ